ncbi:nuclear hormone receptor HR96-like [Oppia nitens]|uniref:nuclear hormone receptor HR96-like n=1 Tax=Oppia nitens TaxID=1686743 RepID=UPI0023DCE3AE|nr:nuclear hormone receptor HR96-like [Oppia nitens]
MTDKESTGKICGVCGDKAIAKNFGAVSCESCKAFFRRNAHKLNVYKCYFDEKCKLDSVTRKFCRRCRLKKCFDIGMKQEWILNDEEKQIRRKKIEDKRKKRKNSVQSSSSDSKNSDSNASNSPPDLLANLEMNTTLDLYDNQDISDDEIITNIVDIESYIFNGEKVEDDDNDDDISPDVYQKAVELEFAVLPIARTVGDNSGQFNELEYNRLTELFSALNIMQIKIPENGVPLSNMEEMCQLMAVKVDTEIRNLVTVSKGLSAFNNMCENDQISLLKYGSLEIFCMRSVLTYDYSNDSWTLVMEDNQSIILNFRTLPEAESVFISHKNYLRKLGKEWDSDPYILDLLTAIVLFNPDRPNLIHKDMVKLQQQLYMYLLQRYLLLKTKSECHSKEKFLRLLNTLHDLSQFIKVKNSTCAHSAKSGSTGPPFGPLLREILDIQE